MVEVRLRRVRWVPGVFARWLAGALVAIGILYVWILYVLTHHACPAAVATRVIGPRRGQFPPPPCGYHTAWFIAMLAVSAAVVLVPVTSWYAISRRVRRKQ